MHDDIVKRLLDYRRHLRGCELEGPAPAATASPRVGYYAAFDVAVATEIPTDEVVDIASAEDASPPRVSRTWR